MKIGSLHVHPVKGGRAVSLGEAELERAGLADDRRWMVVDRKGRFVSQREMPKLALLDARTDADGLILTFEDDTADNGGERFVPTPDGEERLAVTVWRSSVDAALADEAANAALSDWLGADLRLVYMDEASIRLADDDFAGPDAPVGFADGYPLLVANQASLRALNASIVEAGGAPVPMSRFRPNLVIDGAEPWAEDGWKTLGIGETVLDLVKPCARCEVTTVDQQTGLKDGAEPLSTLRRDRFSADRRVPGVLFGWNAVPRRIGRLCVGDDVIVLERRPSEGVVRGPARRERANGRPRPGNGAA